MAGYPNSDAEPPVERQSPRSPSSLDRDDLGGLEVVPSLGPRRRLFAGGVQDVADDDVHGRGSKSEIVAQGRGDSFLDGAGRVMDGPVIVHRDGQVHDGGAT